MNDIAKRVSGEYNRRTSSEKRQLMWAADQVSKANDLLRDVHDVLTARDGSGPPYEGFESIADGNSMVGSVVSSLVDASALLGRSEQGLRKAGSASRMAGAIDNQLTGVPKRVVLRRINTAIEKARLGGMFKDTNWAPIHRLWKELDKADIEVQLLSAEYSKDQNGNPSSKTWKFRVEWDGPEGRPQVVYGQVVASGAGSVSDPLEMYDVVAYAN